MILATDPPPDHKGNKLRPCGAAFSRGLFVAVLQAGRLALPFARGAGRIRCVLLMLALPPNAEPEKYRRRRRACPIHKDRRRSCGENRLISDDGVVWSGVRFGDRAVVRFLSKAGGGQSKRFGPGQTAAINWRKALSGTTLRTWEGWDYWKGRKLTAGRIWHLRHRRIDGEVTDLSVVIPADLHHENVPPGHSQIWRSASSCTVLPLIAFTSRRRCWQLIPPHQPGSKLTPRGAACLRGLSCCA
jgi:hypothetical protein